MKHLTSLLALAALVVGLGSCDKCREQTDCGCGDKPLHQVSVDLSGAVVNVASRALSVTDAQESQVNSCVLYIFNANGTFVERQSSTSGSFSAYLTDGIYRFVALVNAPSLPEQPASYDALMKNTFTLADNTVGNFLMSGGLDNVNISADARLTIDVKRYVAKMDYKLRVNFSSPAYAAKTFTVEAIYLTNVQGRNAYDLSAYQATDGLWYHRRNYLEMDSNTTCDDMLYAKIDKVVPQGDSIATPHTFYCLPNNCTDPDDRSGWSARSTRFVVKALIGTEVNYYPVTICPIERNKYYHLDITITGPGVGHPEDKPSKLDFLEAMIKVLPWEDGGTINSTF